MKNNKLEQQTTLQKVTNATGVAFNIICLCYGMYSIVRETIECITGKTNDESKETEVADKIVVEE